jgi:hypothetical protein
MSEVFIEKLLLICAFLVVGYLIDKIDKKFPNK